MRRNNVAMRRRMMYGGYESTPAGTNSNSMAAMQAQSLAQGNQFLAMHKNQHGGAGAAPMPSRPPPPGPMFAGPAPMPAGPSPTNLTFSGNVAIRPPSGPPASGLQVVRQAGGGLDAGPFPGAVTQTSVLPENLHASARVAPLDAAIREIQGLKDQSGGAKKRRGSRKSKKATRKGRKGRKQRGGAWSIGNEQSVSAPGLILSPALEAKALGGMNAEWKLAEDPKSFAPGYKSY